MRMHDNLVFHRAVVGEAGWLWKLATRQHVPVAAHLPADPSPPSMFYTGSICDSASGIQLDQAP